MQKVFEDDTITIPVPNHKTLAIGTLQSIIKQSDLSRKLFET
jgi:predicted RNA binding protein YcfA (HicA-like mRNA interferase family)